MQFPYSWLKTQADFDLSPEQLAHLLTMAGLEVEETVPAAPAFSGVVVAEVKSVEKHPDADRLNITQVDAGTGEILQIVCGAPNVRAGIKVPCAVSGALLPNDFKIKPTKMRGQVSNGMLCSASELGLPEKENGLLILPNDAPVGKNIREYLDLDDTIFTLKITPNRADCLSVRGLAREVAALSGAATCFDHIAPVAETSTRTQAVKIDTPADCGRFISRVIESVDARAPSPEWLVRRLERSGIRSISALVDIGNYVMLELGQPMHVFDADKLTGNIIVRRAQEGETLLCLNDKTVSLSNNTLVVADEQGALSIAGLMGGASSAVNDDTQNIVLESAWFTPEIISGKSRQYGFGSDSSFRFERGVDFELTQVAMERASALIVEICGGHVGKMVEALGDLPQRNQVTLRNTRVGQVLGIEIDATQIQRILTDLGLQPITTEHGFQITAPSFRFDIAIEADIIEEIARVYGYENIPDNHTSGRLAMLAAPETHHPRFAVYQHMAARGFQETVSYAFTDEQWEQDFANNPNPIRLQNPLAAQFTVMRSTLIGSLVDILQNNLNRKQTRVRIFEIARVFAKNDSGEFTQTEKLGALVYGSAQPEQWGEKTRPVDFYDFKADVEALLHGKKVVWVKAEHPALHPGRSANVVIDGQTIGFMGELHPKWVQKYGLPNAPLVCELDMNAITTREKTVYRAVSKFQAVRRDLAFVLPENVCYAELMAALHNVQSPLVQEISLFDVYRGAGLPNNTKSMAVKIMLQDQQATLTDETIEPIMTQFIVAAEKIGAKLR